MVGNRFVKMCRALAVMLAAAIMTAAVLIMPETEAWAGTSEGKSDKSAADLLSDTYSQSSGDDDDDKVIAAIEAAEGIKLNVIDTANILGADEEEKLTELCQKVSKNCNTDVVIITMRTGKDYSVMDNYIRDIIEKYYGYSGTGKNSDAIVYAIDMVSRADRIITSGNARSDISQSHLDDIRESAEKKLADGDYYEGCRKFAKGVERRMNRSVGYRLTLYLPVKIIIAAVIAVVVVLAMMSSAKSKMTVNAMTYQNGNIMVHQSRDNFIRTTVTTRTISSSSGGGGGGGGGGGNSGSSGGHF